MNWLWLRWNNWPLSAKGLMVVILPLGLLLGSMLYSYPLWQQTTQTEAEVRRTLHAQANIQLLHTLIAEAATSVRGYLLTGRDDFLAPYRKANAQLPKTLRDLRKDVRDPQQHERLAHILRLLEEKLASLDTLRTQGRQMSVADLQTHMIISKGILDQLRDELQAMQEREAILLAQRTQAASAALQRYLVMNVAAALLGLVGGIIAMLLFSSGIVRRVQRVAANAERLASGSPLAPIPAASDELGQLAERLQNASQLLATRAAEAQAANHAKTEFLSRTSHELRTPLNAILGFAQLLATDLKDASAARNAAQIQSAGRHLLTLIDDVLDIARIEAGQLKLDCVVVPLAPLLAEASALIAPLAAQHGILIEMGEIAPAIAAHADHQRLRQVLLNLLSNAIKYNRAGGWVRIDAKYQNGHVCIAVRDAGVGIAAPLLQRLFNPFDRLGAERQNIEGTGLGLAVSKQLMQCMGGDIEIESTLGVGSVFTLVLAGAETHQAHSAPPARPAEMNLPTQADPATTCRVLCIEDNASNLALIEVLLARRPRWQLVSARSGYEGLQAASEQQPDLILLDLHLPDLSGEAVLAKLLADPVLRDIPVAILSADVLPATIERMRVAGASDYLTKPLDVVRFFALLDRVCA